MTTTKKARAKTNADVSRLGIMDLRKLVETKQLGEPLAFSIIDARIKARQAKGKNLIPAIVAYRNELAAKTGHKKMPVPVYNTKTVLNQDPAALAKQIVDAGINPAALVTEITKLAV
jgi:hypothetical protein